MEAQRFAKLPRVKNSGVGGDLLRAIHRVPDLPGQSFQHGPASRSKRPEFPRRFGGGTDSEPTCHLRLLRHLKSAACGANL